jgi:hypothetical protein
MLIPGVFARAATPRGGVWAREDPVNVCGRRTSSTLLGRVDEFVSTPGDGLQADAADAGPGAEQRLELSEYGVERQAGTGAFGSLRNWVQNAWATAVSVTWRCQPV